MAGPGDAYRLKAAHMLARAEEHASFRLEFENLAKAFLRLADQADRNSQLLPLELDVPAGPQSQQSSDTVQEQPQQQQQQVQRKDKPTE
jgi:hypothetical protein